MYKRVLCLACAAFCLLAVPASAAEYPNMDALYTEWENNGYPDYCGGAFKENETWTVLLCDDSDGAGQAEILSELDDTENILFEDTKYSMNRLQEIEKEIQEEYMVDNAIGRVLSTQIVYGTDFGYADLGVESRLQVQVEYESYPAFTALFQEEYNDAVIVLDSNVTISETEESSEETAASTTSGDDETQSGGNYIWVPVIFGTAALLTFFTVRSENRKRKELEEEKRKTGDQTEKDAEAGDSSEKKSK